MAPEIVELLDARFFKIIRGSPTDSYKYVSETFDLTNGLDGTELFSGENTRALEYLFSVAALSISSKANSGLVHPIISIPSVGSLAVFNLLVERLTHYAKQEPNVKFKTIDCKQLVGHSRLYEQGVKSIEIPNLVKWRMENEDACFGTKIFILYDADVIVSSETLTLKDVISELGSISEDASFIVFLKPSSYYFVIATLGTEDFNSKFSRLKVFDGFDVSDAAGFKSAVENRLKKSNSLAGIVIDDLGLEVALSTSRGVPAYAFKIIQEAIRAALLEGTNEISDAAIINVKNELMIDSLWNRVDALTPGQIDLLTILTTFSEDHASVYNLKERLRLTGFRKFSGDRSAILQQLRKMYENELLDRDRPPGSRQVYYSIRKSALPAIEYRIKQMLQSVK